MTDRPADIEIVSARPLGGVMSFFLPDAFDDALRRSSFSLAEELELLVDTIRHATSGWERIAAMRYFDQKAERALELSGAIRQLQGRVTRTDADGTQAILETKGLKLLDRAAQHAQTIKDFEEQEDDGCDDPGVEEPGFTPEKALAPVEDTRIDDALPGDSSHDAYLQSFDGHRPPSRAGGGLS